MTQPRCTVRFCLLFQIINEIVGDERIHVQAGVAATDAVVAVCIDVHVKLDAGLYECFAIFCRVAEVHIVVGQAMDEQQLAV